MQLFKKYSPGFLIIISLFISCNKEEDKDILNLPDKYLDWFYFDKGSYWIYDLNIDEGSDTLTVSSTFFLTVHTGSTPYVYEEYMEIDYEPNPFGILFDNVTASSAYSRMMSDSTQFALYDVNNSQVGVEFATHDKHGNVIGSSKLENIFGNYTVGNNTFDSVMVIKISDIINSRVTRYYLAKGIGSAQIETIEINDTLNWVLGSWKVVN